MVIEESSRGGGEGGDTAVTVGIKRGVLTHWDPSPFALTELELDPISASKLGQLEGGIRYQRQEMSVYFSGCFIIRGGPNSEDKLIFHCLFFIFLQSYGLRTCAYTRYSSTLHRYVTYHYRLVLMVNKFVHVCK